MAEPINPSVTTWPGDNMYPDDIDYNAGQLRGVGGNVSSTCSGVETTWGGLSKGYHAPEAQTLFGAMKPAGTLASDFASDLDTVATALEVFANDVRAVQSTVAGIRSDSYKLLDKIHDGKVTVDTSL
jgi:hypothetical protein